MSEIELEKIYAAHETIKSLNFEKMEFIEPRGRNVPEGVAYELGEGLALKLKDSNQTHFFISGDGRISTPWLMQAFANAMLDNGINVIYSGYNNTTPMFEVERGKLGISGVNITASHNPWQYNGFKMAIEKAIEDGKTKDKIEAKLEELLKKGGTIQQKNQAKIYYLQSTLRKDYIKGLENKFAEFFRIGNGRGKKEKILFDALQGPAFPFYYAVARKLNIEFEGFREDIDGYFPLTDGGPSPLLKENFEILKRSLNNLGQYSLILITDGDGDRLSAAFSSGLVDFAVLGAVRATYLAEKDRLNKENKNFVAEYALAKIISRSLAKKNIKVIPTARSRKSIKAGIDELIEKGEKVLGGQEIGTHPYNSEGIDDGVEDALLFSTLLQTKGKKGLDKMIEEAKKDIPPHIHEIRVFSKEPNKIRSRLLSGGYVEKFGDVVCALNETEAVVHSSNTAKQITLNAYGDNTDSIKNDLNKLLKEIDKIENGLGEKMTQQLEIIS